MRRPLVAIVCAGRKPAVEKTSARTTNAHRQGLELFAASFAMARFKILCGPTSFRKELGRPRNQVGASLSHSLLPVQNASLFLKRCLSSPRFPLQEESLAKVAE